MSIFSTILEKIGIGKPAAANPAPDKAKIDATVTNAMAKAEAEAKARVAAQTAASPDAKSPAVSASATPSTTAGPSTPITTAASSTPATPSPSPAPAPAQAHPAAVPMVDVMSKLEGLSRSHPDLNWKVSIVDLLKLLDMDSSFEARKSLAQELGCPPNLMNDSASMNTWLHKTVLEKIAENGGNIPATLLNK